MSGTAHHASVPVSAEPIVLPAPGPLPHRATLPIVATVAPVAAAGVLWLITGSPLTLLFAALGPLIAVATIADAARSGRRARRVAAAETAEGVERARAEVRRRHEAERAALWAARPDAGGLLGHPDDVWRPASARGDALVLGTGEGTSGVRVVGGGDDPAAEALRTQAGALAHIPVSAPLGAGVCVVGPAPLAAAIARALVVQVLLVHPPDRVSLVTGPPGEEWTRDAPHHASHGLAGRMRLTFTGPGQPVPPDADIAVAIAAPGAPVPSRCGAVLTVTGADTALLAHAADRRSLVVEGISHRQAAAVAAALAARASAAADRPGPVTFAELDTARAAPAGHGGLSVPIGREQDADAFVDLVADGPHAVVAGVTGSGKSELLVTWIAALCATRPPSEVCFLLADFKGGTAFDALGGLPHVTGVLTDLDGAGARRAIESLRAELRRREAELAAAGARDIGQAGVRVPRLVIVVDEFAAVLSEHPELHVVFTDIAARGRALGMHLVLGTQRVTGVVRDALLANCPLRVSLRVTDAADSRAVLGVEHAAALPGDQAARGLAYVRRAADAGPRLTRVALTTAADIEAIAATRGPVEAPRAPWLPALPARIPLEPLRADATAGALVLGRADEPHRQRQPLVELTIGVDRGLAAVGAAGSGKTNVIDLLAAQAPPGSVLRVPATPEAAWDAVEALAADVPRAALVLIDDLDALAVAFPPDYAVVLVERIERIVRAAGSRASTVVVTAQRLTGAIARVAELLPLRAVLPTASRVDHLAAGGDAAAFDPSAPPGRALLAGRIVQFAVPAGPAGTVPADPAVTRRTGAATEAPEWTPRSAVTAVVARSARARARVLAARLPSDRVLPLDELPGGVRVDELPGPRCVVVGDPDGWQRQWSLFCRVRADHDVVVAAECAADFRSLTGRRELPPYIAHDEGRAWLVPPSAEPTRVVLATAGDG